MGVVVTRVYRAIEFKYSNMFSWVTTEVSEARKRAEREGARAADGEAQCLKMIGNR